MYFGEVLKHEDKPLVYVGMIDGTESFIPVDNFIQFASEMLKEASLFGREKETNSDYREHSDESRFNHIEYGRHDITGNTVIKIYTDNGWWCPFEDGEWDTWIVIDEIDHPVMCLIKDYIHDSFQGFCDKMKRSAR